MADLLPCPFCGETTEFRTTGAGTSVAFVGDQLRVMGGQPGTPIAFIVCGTCHTRGPGGESVEQAIANWNRRPTSTLQGSASWLRRQQEGHVDDLAAARERRELASLPSIATTAGEGGVGLDFDLGGPPPSKPPKR